MNSMPGLRTSALRWKLAGVLVVVMVAVLAAMQLRQTAAVTAFIQTYPGSAPQPESAPVGIPPWLAWQHFLNLFMLVLVVRTGYRYRALKSRRPDAFWWSRRTKDGQRPQRISVDLWFHLAVDLLWLVNGVVFVVLLATTGQWMRIVPTSWEVFPNALSVVVQYLSLGWPTENSWVAYNALQQLLYFVTVFIAAPLAALTGYRLSYLWPQHNLRLAKLLPFDGTLRVHIAVMVYFVIFVIAHVTMVFATGALRNLNHMFAANDGDSWAGVMLFALAVAAIVITWFAVRPSVVKRIAAVFGNVK